MVSVKWQKESGAVGTLNKNQSIQIESGLVELKYKNGAQITMQGPAHLVVTSANSVDLIDGKMVALVPKEAKGFTVKYPNGKVVDMEAEFGINVMSPTRAELAVFHGNLNLHLPDHQIKRISDKQSIVDDRGRQERIQSVVFDETQFVRELPQRDFAWKVASQNDSLQEFDVSHLVWKPAKYRAIFKWMRGADLIHINDVELLRNGQVVTNITQHGRTGRIPQVKDNVFVLEIPETEWEGKAKWTLRVKLTPSSINHVAPLSEGLIQFEDEVTYNYTAADFVGKWHYSYLGDQYSREFLPDGGVKLWMNGKLVENSIYSRWEIDNGILSTYIKGDQVFEKHMLRDFETLIFLSNPYENATKDLSDTESSIK